MQLVSAPVFRSLGLRSLLIFHLSKCRYRTRKVNWEDDKAMSAEARKGLKQPTLFIQALNDNILIPEMSKGMEAKIPNLTRGEVKSGHWALWQTPHETNDIIKGWFESVVFGGKSKI